MERSADYTDYADYGSWRIRAEESGQVMWLRLKRWAEDLTSTDYKDFVRSSCTFSEDQKTYPAKAGFFGSSQFLTSNRNLRNLCNLRILNCLFNLRIVLG
jgi:hypothetical protein